jgi:hypothetical protein
VEWCRIGPAAARVDRLDVSDGTYHNEFATFFIAY